MKIPRIWLLDYVDLKGLSDEEISNALTMSGTENKIEKNIKFPGIVVGEIKEISMHPDADRIRIVQTDVGKKHGGILQIICGASNIEVGQKVPVALVGAQIGEFFIEEKEIRGVKSFGMLCSESELGISDDHSGIMILDPRAQVGQKLEEALNIGGTVFEAEITPNRSDCFSIIGVAREAAVSLGRKLKLPKIEKETSEGKSQIEVEIKNSQKCPRYIAKIIEGVKVGPSPQWLKERLSAAGIRSINNIVDITNFVMLEYGQPLHAFDARKIKEKIIVRNAEEGEKLFTLDGVERKLNQNDLVICDGESIVALAGVMGGQNSEVSDKTTDIILEAAVFDSVSVRKTAQRLGLRTEASNRFEKGIPLNLPEIAIERAASLVKEIAGGIPNQNTDILSKWIWIQRIGLRLSRLKNILGIEIPEEKVISILRSLGFEVERFNIKEQARRHLGKPYVWGASFKTHGDMAFDCSYLTDYIYSLIGKFIGHTALAQFESGIPVELDDLKPGDLLFIKGKIINSATDHYYENDGSGNHKKVKLKEPKEVGHVAIYIGGGRIIHASRYDYNPKTKRWSSVSKEKAMVREENLESFVNHPEFLGARRYVENIDDFLAITVPWWRLDVKIEEDIIEEIGRIYGYENLDSHLPSGEMTRFQENKVQNLIKEIREALMGIGYSEVYNYSFYSSSDLEIEGYKRTEAVKIANPINPEQEYMRLSLIPSLLKNISLNQFNFDDIKIFEIASIYLTQKGQDLPEENLQLAMAVRLMSKNGLENYYELKSVWDLLVARFNLSDYYFDEIEKEEGNYRNGIILRSKQGEVAKIFIAPKSLGEHYGIKSDVALMSLNLSVFMNLMQPRFYQPISRFPISRRDFNLILPSGVTVSEIQKEILKAGCHNLIKSEVIDVYEGKGLEPGHKSITIRLYFGSKERTLTEKEIIDDQDVFLSHFAQKFGAKLRG